MSEPIDQPALVPSSIKGIHHVGMAVRDLQATLDFYQSTTTMERFSQDSISANQLTAPELTAVLKAPNGFIELMQFPTPEADASVMPVEGPGITHLCFQSPASFKLYKKFEAANATAITRGQPPVDLTSSVVQYAYARDANDIMFEVEQLDEPQFEGPIWLAHVAIVTHDIDQLVEFYRDLLGIEPYGRANKVVGPNFDAVTGLDNVRIRAAWFNTGNMVIELWQFINPVTPAPGEPSAFDHTGYNKFAFEVGDLQAECARLSAAGVKFIGDPIEKNGITEVYARDPDGNLFSLLQTAPTAFARVADLKQIKGLASPSSPLVAKNEKE